MMPAVRDHAAAAACPRLSKMLFRIDDDAITGPEFHCVLALFPVGAAGVWENVAGVVTDASLLYAD